MRGKVLSAVQQNTPPFRIVVFRDFVPDGLRFWLLVAFGVIFQFSGGIYLALTSQMVGSLALLQEDVMIAGYASFAGMTMVFPLLFRFKSRFITRNILLAASLGLAACNLIAINTKSLPVLVVVCFFAGILRMCGLFECMSTIQLKITPTRDFAVFFPFVYSLVLGSIQLSGITAGYIAYYFRWEYMQLFIIGLLLCVALCVLLLILPVRVLQKQPLDGIDWIGCFLWTLFLFLMIFILEYGEYYDWFDSGNIRLACVSAALLLGVSLRRAKTVSHPYIDLHAFKQRHVGTILFLFGAMCILLASSNVLENAFTGRILHYDQLTTLKLNRMVFLGILAGAVISYAGLVRMQWGYKFMTAIGFALITGYLVLLYFTVSPAIDQRMLYLPLMLRGAGHIVVYITLTVYAARTIPFLVFFQVLTIFGFVRTGFGTPLGTAIFGRAFSVLLKGNMMSHSMEMDPQNSIVNAIPLDTLLGVLQRQAMLITIKEIYGYAAIAGVLILLLALSTRYTNRLKLKMPR